MSWRSGAYEGKSNPQRRAGPPKHPVPPLSSKHIGNLLILGALPPGPPRHPVPAQTDRKPVDPWSLAARAAQEGLAQLRKFYAPYNEHLYTVVQVAGIRVLPNGSGRAFL